MLTILDPKHHHSYHSFRQFFDLNGEDYVYISDPDHAQLADFLICNHFYRDGLDPKSLIEQYQHRRSLYMAIRHNEENQVLYIDHAIGRGEYDMCITNAWDPTVNNSSIIFNDFVFNFVKSYYIGWDYSEETELFVYAGKNNYKIPMHPNADEKDKIFLAPNFTFNGTRKYRTRLVKKLIHDYHDHGYIGSIDTDPNLKLYSQDVSRLELNIKDLIANCYDRPFHKQTYSPPHVAYYQDTFISIYGETIEHGSSIAVTEKTFDPLIKGHFILPFSTAGFISFLIDHYGFRMPDFIDYSYDRLTNDDERFSRYCDEIDRLMSLSNWKDLWQDNLDIVRHNQQVFLDRPYHKARLPLCH